VREGTHAARFPDLVAAHVAAERSRELREIGVDKGRSHAAGRTGEEALVAVETENSGLTGDYLRVRVHGATEPGRLFRSRLSGSASDLSAVAGATGRAALPVLAATIQGLSATL
jgi:tRNA A37 methylthiotransferase MiaB